MLLSVQNSLARVYRGTTESPRELLRQVQQTAQAAKQLLADIEGSMAADALADWPIPQLQARIHDLSMRLQGEAAIAQSVWTAMEQPGIVSEKQYAQAFDDVSATLEGLGLEWWPCRGTLIALMRYGSSEATLSDGTRHVVERDIDVMIKINGAEHYAWIARKIEIELRSRGWLGCFAKTSATWEQEPLWATRKDLLYCIKNQPYFMLLDASTYLYSDDGTEIFVHEHRTRNGTRFVPPSVGPLSRVGGVLPSRALRPFQKCQAFQRTCPCPQQPNVTLRAMLLSDWVRRVCREARSWYAPEVHRFTTGLQYCWRQRQDWSQIAFENLLPGQMSMVHLLDGLHRHGAVIERNGCVSMTRYLGQCLPDTR
mmetsp:Transcript_118055/g.270810  ORF Transcript_118055/g.270810 Transcript_118055/m.270810 type:complete len:369 (-) Transcript_118055:286-1392(-)